MCSPQHVSTIRFKITSCCLTRYLEGLTAAGGHTKKLHLSSEEIVYAYVFFWQKAAEQLRSTVNWHRLLLEAAAFGASLWEAEAKAQLQNQFGTAAPVQSVNLLRLLISPG